MDPRIAALKSTTFLGRRFTRRQIADIRETVELFPNDSRNELSKTVCEHLDWTTPKGGYRVAAGLRLLEHLEACGILTLPEKRDTAAKSARGPVVRVRASDPQPEIACALAALEPLSLEEAASPEDVALWKHPCFGSRPDSAFFGGFRGFPPGFSTPCPQSCPHPGDRPGRREPAGRRDATGPLIRSEAGGPPRDAARAGVSRRRPPSGPPARAGRAAGRSRPRPSSASPRSPRPCGAFRAPRAGRGVPPSRD